jgi:hypothetical protein
MSPARQMRTIGPAGSPRVGQPAPLDGDPESMFPLLDAKTVARRLGCSADLVHDLWHSGQLPFVLLPSSVPGSTENEARRRRCRTDHLADHVKAWTRE